MQLLVIRHAIAEDREAFRSRGKDDSLRPLTKEGRARMRRGAHGLRRQIADLDLLASSPFRRAMQTAQIVSHEYGVGITQVPELRPDQTPEAFAAWLSQQPFDGTIAAVGHEPLLGLIVAHLVARRTEPLCALGKGAACLVSFPGEVAAAAGIIEWALTPKLLRRLGR